MLLVERFSLGGAVTKNRNDGGFAGSGILRMRGERRSERQGARGAGEEKRSLEHECPQRLKLEEAEAKLKPG
jgi:hypothetical protein